MKSVAYWTALDEPVKTNTTFLTLTNFSSPPRI
jgi:hypothetical protein